MMSIMIKRKFYKLIVLIATLFVLLPLVSCEIWRPDTEISDDTFAGSKSLVESDPASIPEYSGEDYVVLNDGKPCFNVWDLANIIGEHYSDLDRLGRCGCAYALLDRSMMPSKKREDIG